MLDFSQTNMDSCNSLLGNIEDDAVIDMALLPRTSLAIFNRKAESSILPLVVSQPTC